MSKTQPPRRQTAGRGILAALLAAALIAVAAGLYVGSALADPLAGARMLILTPFPEGAADLPSDMVPADSVVRLTDNRIAIMHEGTYGDAALDAATSLFMRVQLGHAKEWADSYVSSGSAAEHRWHLQILGDQPRTIVIDNPLANPAIPESLYQLLSVIQRPQLVGSPVALEPDTLRVRLSPIPAGAEILPESILALPAQIDASTAQSPTGAQLSGAGLAELDQSLQLRANLGLGHSHLVVRLADGSLRYLDWNVDWASWTSS